ncbi:MAG: type II secretion system protein [Pseudohongiellaceae bacterium]
MPENKKQKGVTMVELVLTIVILAIALTGISVMLSRGFNRSSDALIQLRAVSLAQAYLDEILGKRFDENSRNSGIPPCRGTTGPLGRRCSQETGTPQPEVFGPDGSETRATYDDVDDYHNLSEGFGTGNDLEDAQGVLRTGYDNYTVNVSVRYINVGVGEEEESFNVNNELDDQYDAKLITVTIGHSSQSPDFAFSAYKSNF